MELRRGEVAPDEAEAVEAVQGAFTGRLAAKQYWHPKSPYSTSVSLGLFEPVT